MVSWGEYHGSQTDCVIDPVSIVLASAVHALLFQMTPPRSTQKRTRRRSGSYVLTPRKGRTRTPNELSQCGNQRWAKRESCPVDMSQGLICRRSSASATSAGGITGISCRCSPLRAKASEFDSAKADRIKAEWTFNLNTRFNEFGRPLLPWRRSDKRCYRRDSALPCGRACCAERRANVISEAGFAEVGQSEGDAAPISALI